MSKKSTEFVSENYLHINSCGCEKPCGLDVGSIRPHGRSDYHILYITEGVCFVTIDNKTLQAPAGSVIVYLPHQRQEYRFHKNISSKSYYIHFTGKGCADLMSRFKMTDKNIFYVGYSYSIESLFNSLIDEFHLKLDYYDDHCQGLFLSIVSSIARKIKEAELPHERNIRKQINKVCRDIYANYGDDISVKSLARQCNLSESRFSHIFKEIVGISPKQYILNAKIEISKELLKNTDIPISQISNKTGFQSQNYFSRVFKKYTGLSPTEYREK